MRGGLYYAAYADFNPRSRKESDVTVFNCMDYQVGFQSTLSQGERPWVYMRLVR